MSHMDYNVVFRGEISSGKHVNSVKEQLAILHKTEVAKIERHFFTGKPVVVKRTSDIEIAQKAKSAFERAGAICTIEVIQKNTSRSPDEDFADQLSQENVLAEQKYNVIFLGQILNGHNREHVKQKLAALYKVPIEQCETMFTGSPVTIKKDVDYQTAQKYQRAFKRIGAICKIKSTEPSVGKNKTLSDKNDKKASKSLQLQDIPQKVTGNNSDYTQKASSQNSKEKKSTMKFQFAVWNAGGKMIFISSCMAIISFLLPWVDIGFASRNGFSQGTIFLFILYLVPLLGIFRDKHINKILGIFLGSIAIGGTIAYIFSKNIELFGETRNAAGSGAYLFILATLGFVIGILLHKPSGDRSSSM